MRTHARATSRIVVAGDWQGDGTVIIANSAEAQQIREVLWREIMTHPNIDAVWIRWHRTTAEIFLVTHPVDLDTELALYDLEGQLHERFPDLELDVHMINPAHYQPFNQASVIPPDAEPVTRR